MGHKNSKEKKQEPTKEPEIEPTKEPEIEPILTLDEIIEHIKKLETKETYLKRFFDKLKNLENSEKMIKESIAILNNLPEIHKKIEWFLLTDLYIKYDLEFILLNPELEWSWYYNFPGEEIEKYIENKEINWDYISRLRIISPKLMLKYPEINWRWSMIDCYFPSDPSMLYEHFTEEEYDIIFTKRPTLNVYVSTSYISLETITKHQNLNWDWDCVIQYKVKTFEDIIRLRKSISKLDLSNDRIQKMYITYCMKKDLENFDKRFLENKTRLPEDIIDKVCLF